MDNLRLAMLSIFSGCFSTSNSAEFDEEVASDEAEIGAFSLSPSAMGGE